MKRQISIIVLSATCVLLGLGLYGSKRDNKHLRQDIAQLKENYSALETDKDRLKAAYDKASRQQPQANRTVPANSIVAATPQAEEQSHEVKEEQKPDSGRRMMRSMSKMMDNPAMNKVMEASQRGAIGALYEDLIEYFQLDDDEKKYFLDLHVSRQMKNIDMGMKMMSGELSEEEQEALAEELKQTSELVKEGMEYFLNNPDDFAEWEFYEKTMGERMMLSHMDQELAESDVALSYETYRELLELMHEEKKRFQFTSDLHDDENMDMSAERFSKEHLLNYANDMERLNGVISARAQGILPPEQFSAFIESLNETTEMQQAQLEIAAQMFGDREK